jgi:osmotically-inducible protein OsmY
MIEPHASLEAVREALRSEPRIKLETHPIQLAFDSGDLVMEGEVADIAAKKLALERAASVQVGRSILDRLRVHPAERMSDGQIRDLVRDALSGETAFADCAIRVWIKDRLEIVQEPDTPTGTIDVKVESGVVTLDGDVPGLVQKRLAGVLAWWVPGSRDVINGLGVTPPEEDNDGAITDAVRIALEKDPFVNAEQIRVGTCHSVVTLTGLVPAESEREMAEFDAWYVFGVDNVINKISVRA